MSTTYTGVVKFVDETEKSALVTQTETSSDFPDGFRLLHGDFTGVNRDDSIVYSYNTNPDEQDTVIDVTAPVFSVAEGTYHNNQSVTITTATAGDTIKYTTDGSTPTSTHGSIYSSAITISATTTLKAIGYKEGMEASGVTSATYTLVASTPVLSVVTGTYANNQTMTVTCATSGVTLKYSVNGSDPTTGSTYTVPVTIGASETFKAIAIKSGYTSSAIVSSVVTLVAATPTISTSSGTYTTSTGAITITTATTGGDVSIRYTITGVDPIISDSAYTVPIHITESHTLKAKVFKTGYTSSSVASKTYTII